MTLTIPTHVLLKLQAWRDMGPTEVTGFFITDKDNPLQVIDALLIESTCSSVTIDIKPEAETKMYMDQTAQGIYPDQLMIWWHTHPGASARPSATDIETFEEYSEDRTSNIMYILSKTNEDFARICVRDPKTGLSITKDLEVEYVTDSWINFPDYEDLKIEYHKKVMWKKCLVFSKQKAGILSDFKYDEDETEFLDWEEELYE